MVARVCTFVTIIILGAIILMIYLVDHALKQEKIPQFLVESAAVTGLNIPGSSELSATWNMTLVSHNPNRKLAIDYSGVQVFIYFGTMDGCWYYHGELIEHQHILATKLLPPFFLGAGNRTSHSFRVGVAEHTVDGDTAMQVREGKTVKFGVFLDVEYRYRTKGWFMGDTTRSKLMCDQVEFLLQRPNTDHYSGVSNHQFPCQRSNY